MTRRPLAWGGCAFALGVWSCGYILLSRYAGSAPWLAAGLAALAVASGAGVFCLSRKTGKKALELTRIPAVLTAAALLAAAFSAGMGWRWAYHRLWIAPVVEKFCAPTEPDAPSKPVKPGMVVTGYPSETRYGYLIPVELEGVATALYVDDVPDCEPGDTLTCWAYVMTDGRNGYVLRASQIGPVTVKEAPAIPLTLQPVRMRHALLGRMDRLFGDKTSALPKALVTGDKSDFTDSFQRALSTSGLSHTVAVSGLHISYIAGIMLFLFGGTRRSAYLAIPVIWLFVALVGFPASAVRAAVMNTAVLLAPLLRRDYDSFSALGLALALIVAQKPYAATEAGLHLSFAATLGILLFASRWRDAMLAMLPALKSRVVLRGLAATLSTTLAALVFTMPLTAYYFGTVSLVAPLSNLLMLPLISVLFIGTLASSGLSYLWLGLGIAPSWVLKWGFAVVEGYVRLIARLPYAALSTQNSMPAVFFLLYLYALLMLCFAAKRRGGVRWILPVCAAVCSLCFTLIASTALRGDTLQMVAADVGQGQSVVVSTSSRTVVIDCGSMRGNAGVEVSDLLMSQGRGYIDALILSHFHEDHCNGAATLLELMPVGVLIVPQPGYDSELELEWRNIIESICLERGTAVMYAAQDMLIAMDDCEIQLFAPRNQGPGNESCIATLGEYHGFRFLTTGDLGLSAEHALLETADIPPVSLYIVGHHGSKYASGQELLSQIRPQAAIVSVGANTYGHPTPETMGRLKDTDTAVYRTDIHGNVTVSVRGEKTKAGDNNG